MKSRYSTAYFTYMLKFQGLAPGCRDYEENYAFCLTELPDLISLSLERYSKTEKNIDEESELNVLNLVLLRQSKMNVERTPTERHDRLPSKGPVSIHQQALFVFWLSALLLALFRLLLVIFKVQTFVLFRTTPSGK